MKKVFIAILPACLVTSCGVGLYSVASGMADTGSISFISSESLPVTVIVDGREYNVMSVKTKAYKSGRNIKQTAKNLIKVSSGRHDVKVLSGKEVIYSRQIFISATEHKIIEL